MQQRTGGDLAASCCFPGFGPIGRVMSAGTDSCGVLQRPTHMVRRAVGGHVMFVGYKQYMQDPGDSGGGLQRFVASHLPLH